MKKKPASKPNYWNNILKTKNSLVSSTCTRWVLWTHNLTLHPFFLFKEEVYFELELIGKTIVSRCSQNKEKWMEKIWLKSTYASPKNKYLKRQYWYGNVLLKLCPHIYNKETKYTNKSILSWKTFFYLINTNTHCKTPAVPVHTEGPVVTSESCINRPTDAARDTKDTTYAKKSQSFNLLQ